MQEKEKWHFDIDLSHKHTLIVFGSLFAIIAVLLAWGLWQVLHLFLEPSLWITLLYVPLFIGLCIALGLGLARCIENGLLTPLENLLQNTETIIKNGSYYASLEKVKNDQIDQVRHLMNEMFSKLHQSTEELEKFMKEKTHIISHSKEEVEKASFAKSHFLKNLSHELRTPMHAILMFSSFGIKEYETSDKEQNLKYFTSIHQSGKRLSILLDQLLQLSRLEAGETQFDMHQHNVRDAVHAAIDSVMPEILAKKISLKEEEPDFDTMTLCDPDTITQAVQIVLDNAVSRSEAKSHVEISLHPEKEDGQAYLSIIVKDEGEQIPKEELDSLFGGAVRDHIINADNMSLHIGFIVCREIVEAHQGSISALANKGKKGMKVKLTLPLKNQ